MSIEPPSSANELAELLQATAARDCAMRLTGHNSKHTMGGPVDETALEISTTRLNRLLRYEPRDLTISVEAGMPWLELSSILSQQKQMVALDPPQWPNATVGGVIATNSSGPLRCSYGTARDLVIGMELATIEGKLAKAGGMVVKNVSGLDIGKLLIGSFGTLAAMTSVNFKLHSLPAETKTFLFQSDNLATLVEHRNQVLREPVRPLAMDLVSQSGKLFDNLTGSMLAVRTSGSKAVLRRHEQDLNAHQVLDSEADAAFWTSLRNAPLAFLDNNPAGIVIRVSTKIQQVQDVIALSETTAVSRASAGVTYCFIADWPTAKRFLDRAWQLGWTAVVEHAPQSIRQGNGLWHEGSSDANAAAFTIMENLKHMFDPKTLLNKGRLYGRI